MGMIFPGMDPYLEDPQIWTGVHNALIVYIRDHLQPQLGSRYIAAIEERVFVEGPQRQIVPDVWLRRGAPESRGGGVVAPDADAPVLVRVPGLEIHESYVTILDRHSGQRIVTVIEVVSPSNKFAGPGRDSYVSKQREVLESQSHLVEIDLLRAGPHVVAIPEWEARGRGDYSSIVCVNRARRLRDEYELYTRGLRDRLPKIRIPLADDDPHVPLDVQAVLAQTYDAGRYRERLRYEAPCVPPLSADDREWAEAMIRQAAQTDG